MDCGKLMVDALQMNDKALCDTRDALVKVQAILEKDTSTIDAWLESKEVYNWLMKQKNWPLLLDANYTMAKNKTCVEVFVDTKRQPLEGRHMSEADRPRCVDSFGAAETDKAFKYSGHLKYYACILYLQVSATAAVPFVFRLPRIDLSDIPATYTANERTFTFYSRMLLAMTVPPPS